MSSESYNHKSESRTSGQLAAKPKELWENKKDVQQLKSKLMFSDSSRCEDR